MSSSSYPTFHFYGRRLGRPLRVRNRELYETLLPQVTFDWSKVNRTRPLALEIGFGRGEHLAHQAQQYPDTQFIGSEPFVNGICGMLDYMDQLGLSNVQVSPDDVRHLLPTLPDGCLDRAFILFPDPWPKKRHQERRIVNPETILTLARLIKDSGELRLASDDPSYVEAMLETMEACKQFFVPQHTQDTWHDKSHSWEAGLPTTRYEAKALREGCQGTFLRYSRSDTKVTNTGANNEF